MTADIFQVEINRKKIENLEATVMSLVEDIKRLKSGKGHEYSESFLAFWRAYPRKIAKPAAYRMWGVHRCEEIADKVMKGLLTTVFNHDEGGKYIPHPATWLNQRRWEDEQGVSVTVKRDPITGRVIR